MNTFEQLRPASGLRAARSHSAARPASAFMLALFFIVAGAGAASAQLGKPQDTAQEPRRRERRVTAQATPVRASDEESESGDDRDDEDDWRPAHTDPATAMRTARTICVVSKSDFINAREVEDALRKRKEFQAWGMVITRNEMQADLVLEVSRKAFTRRFTFTVFDPRTMTLVTSGKTRSVLFGKKISNKIAEKFANRVKVVRPYPPVASAAP
jgi:hypothetical protein